MKRKIKTLTEQFIDARTNYNRILREQKTLDKKIQPVSAKGMEVNDNSEQLSSMAANYSRCRISTCDGSTSPGDPTGSCVQPSGGFAYVVNISINGNTPQEGDVFRITANNNPGVGTNMYDRLFYVYEVYQPKPTGTNFSLYTGPDCCARVCCAQGFSPGVTWNNGIWMAGTTTIGPTGSLIPSGMNGNCATNTGQFCSAQNSAPTPGYVTVEQCDGTPFGSQNSFMNMLVDDNGTVREPVIGDEFEAPAGGPGAQLVNWRIIQVGTATSVPPMTFPIVSCPTTPTPTGCPPHDPSIGYPGNFDLSNWINTWTNLPNFSNTTNPNQPCQHICQRIDTWTNTCTSGVGPLQQNMLAGKIEEGNNQSNIHNCASSNAPAC